MADAAAPGVTCLVGWEVDTAVEGPTPPGKRGRAVVATASVLCLGGAAGNIFRLQGREPPLRGWELLSCWGPGGVAWRAAEVEEEGGGDWETALVAAGLPLDTAIAAEACRPEEVFT